MGHHTMPSYEHVSMTFLRGYSICQKSSDDIAQTQRIINIVKVKEIKQQKVKVIEIE